MCFPATFRTGVSIPARWAAAVLALLVWIPAATASDDKSKPKESNTEEADSFPDFDSVVFSKSSTEWNMRLSRRSHLVLFRSNTRIAHAHCYSASA